VGGIPEWQNFNYPMTIDEEWQKIRVKKIVPKKLACLLEEKDFYILDVRPLDFKKNTSFIKGTRLCPLVYLSERYMEIPKDREIIITDWAMKQSPTAAKFLIRKGYDIKGVLKGGIERWESEKLPVEHKEPGNNMDLLTLRE
jgi:rhodanese-related sulfurtransferase